MTVYSLASPSKSYYPLIPKLPSLIINLVPWRRDIFKSVSTAVHSGTAGESSVAGCVSCRVELSVGKEDLLTLKVPKVKNSSYKGPNRRSNSCCDEVVVSAKGEIFCHWRTRPKVLLATDVSTELRGIFKSVSTAVRSGTAGESSVAGTT
nr:hypothetical protein [Tanacetum cinerariifolium]